MEKGKMRQRFLDGCNLAAEPLKQNGFHSVQKGQTWKKQGADKDITYEVYFSSSHYNSSDYIKCDVAINVYSKLVKALDLEQTKNPYENGFIIGSQLGRDEKNIKEWNFAGEEWQKEAQAIASLLKNDALPFFNFFECPAAAAKQLQDNPVWFTNKVYLSRLSSPAFLVIYGEKYSAEKYVNNWLRTKSEVLQKRVRELFNALPSATTIDCTFNEFSDAGSLKQAYLNGVRLWDEFND